MRPILNLAAAAAVFCGLALAESWTGPLVDASCADQQKDVKACQPTATTKMYAIQVDGKFYKLDEAGTAKATEALKNRADRAANPNEAPAPITAKVSGTKDGDVIRVDTVEVQ